MKTQSQEYLLTMVESEPGNSGAAIEAPGSTTAGIQVSTSSGSSLEGVVVSDQREDLTVFFSIGVIVNILMVTAFLVWAIGQWRKTKK